MPDWDFGTAIRAAHDELQRNPTFVGEERAARLLLSFVRENSTPVAIEGLAVSALLQLSNQGWWETTLPSQTETSQTAFVPLVADQVEQETVLSTVDQTEPQAVPAPADRPKWPTVSEIFDQVLRRQSRQKRRARCSRRSKKAGRPRRG